MAATNGSSRSKVVLLQMASHKGNIALIQLNKLTRVPEELLKILGDRNIVKAGVETQKDAQILRDDFNFEVQGMFDLRFLAEAKGFFPGSLQRLSKDVLNLDTDKDWDLVYSDWGQDPLDDVQIKFAEASVKASIDIFKKLISMEILNSQNILSYCLPNLDRGYISPPQVFN